MLRPLPNLAASDATQLAERARARNPQLQAEQARVASAQKSRDLTLSNRYPDWLVGLQSTQVGSRLTSFGLMVELNIPLQQDSRRAQEREAESMVGAARREPKRCRTSCWVSSPAISRPSTAHDALRRWSRRSCYRSRT